MAKKPQLTAAERTKRVTFKANGKTYTFGVGTSMLCRVEDDLGVSFVEAMQRMSIATMRAMLGAGLQDEAGDEVEDVAAIIDDYGPTNVATMLAERISAFSAA